MINAKLEHCKTVEEFYSSIRKQQELAHGVDYCGQHEALMKYAKDCKTYGELGVHQGGTLACALLSGFKYVEGVDIDMSKYYAFLQPLAEKYAKENRIILRIKEMDSTSLDSLGPPVDMLLIDSLHKHSHMEKELSMHAKRVNKYIIAHDTKLPNRRLGECLTDFTYTNPDWKILERNENNVGYMVLKKDV